MEDNYNEYRPQRRRRRRRVNGTAIFFWAIVLMALVAVIVILVRPGKKADVQDPSMSTVEIVPEIAPTHIKEEVTLPIVPETEPPTEAPTAPPTEPPTEAPTEAPTEPPTEAPTEPEETAGIDDPAAYSSVGEAAAAVAKSALGLPFEMGGEGPDKFDTSGLIHFCYKECGVSIPRLVSEQAKAGTEVSLDELQPGDVVFFSFNVGSGEPEYPGIYIGGGNFIAARSSVEKIDTLSMNSSYYDGRFVTARRYY